jgi:hypothetical protein
VPVRRADNGLAERPDRAEQPRELLDSVEVLVHERHIGREAAEVAAGAERRLVRGGEHDAADVAVGASLLERREQVVEQRVAERVARVRLVQRDRRDALGGFVADGLVGGHGGTLSTHARTRPAARTDGTDT